LAGILRRGDAQETSDLRCLPPLPARTLLPAVLAGALRRGDDQAASDLRWPASAGALRRGDDQTPLPVRPGLALVAPEGGARVARALPTLAPPSEFARPTS